MALKPKSKAKGDYINHTVDFRDGLGPVTVTHWEPMVEGQLKSASRSVTVHPWLGGKTKRGTGSGAKR